jgi:hypothetical protein
MDNLALKLIDSMAAEDQPFIIDDDYKAEWALNKMSEERAHTQRMVNVCNTMINKYQVEIQKLKEQLESKTGYLRFQLQEYFKTVPHKATKTQETYKLPSGTLKLKFKESEYVKDEEALTAWAKNNTPEFVKVKESVNWAEMKKVVNVSGGYVCIDGEIIDGVTVQEREPEFEVEL